MADARTASRASMEGRAPRAPEVELANDLRAVDAAFSGLRRSRELDDRFEALLGGAGFTPARGKRTLLPRVVAVGAVAFAATAAMIVFMRPSTDAIATAPSSDAPIVAPSPTQAPTPTAAPSSSGGDALAIAPSQSPSQSPTPTPEPNAPRVNIAPLPAPSVPNGRAPIAPEAVAVGPQQAPALDVKDEDERAPEKAPRKQLSKTRLEQRTVAARISGADLEAALANIRSLKAQGRFKDAVAAVDAVLATNPGARAAESLTLERALLQSRANDTAGACETLSTLGQRWPNGDAAADVAALRAKLGCR